jgi:outer membrane scaffolding protein for murein synthesis (MipA/OmpV family)
MPIALPPDLPLPLPPLPAVVQSPAPKWEGAMGVNLSTRPKYAGAQDRIDKVSPVLFLRYGRFTITHASGFVTRCADDVVRGLGADLVNNPHLRVNLARRFDNGRSESDSGALAGLGDIKPTVRARLNMGWRFEHGLRAGAS